MSKHRKSWNQQQKLEIINYYREKGLTATSVEFGVSSTSIYKWDSLFTEKGEAGLGTGAKRIRTLNCKGYCVKTVS